MSKVILFCGVESSGKSTAIQNSLKYLKNQGKSVLPVWEYGRDVCDESGGVFDMTLQDYEKILHGHQANLLNALNSAEILLLDTDSLYTLHYLTKDKSRLSSDKTKYDYLVALAKNIAKNNINNKRIFSVIYLNSDCEFVQDGTRTYETTRKQDDKNLFKQYSKYYKNCNIVKGKDFQDRTKQIYNILQEIIK